MIFEINRPEIFLLFIPLLAALLWTIVKYVRIKNALFEKNAGNKNFSPEFYRMKRCFALRTLFRFLSVSMLIFAAAGISLGTASFPVQRSGRSVSFVFDISYSMEAQDAPGGISRLEAAKRYAEALLDHMGGVKVSVVMAKGEGTVAIPLTEDFQAVRSFIACLSPELMTAEGTSLGGGIKSAVSSFPAQSASSCSVWIFTDCEETDSALHNSLIDALKNGIPVSIIGFGSERETEIFAGDGITKVKTALRSDAVEKTVDAVNRKIAISQSSVFTTKTFYIDASEMSSATKLLKNLSLTAPDPIITYEVSAVKRHGAFLTLAVIFFGLSVLFGELDISNGRKKLLAQMAASLAVISLFSGCTPRIRDSKDILHGKLSWNSRDYNNAVADFLEASCRSIQRGDETCEIYSVYNLGATYLMQGEDEAALERFDQIFSRSDDKVKFCILYNSGIIAHKNGDYKKAADFFKKALMVDNSSVNAKINLELSLKENTAPPKKIEKEMQHITINNENPALENALYNVIREDDLNKWKNMSSNEKRSGNDY